MDKETIDSNKCNGIEDSSTLNVSTDTIKSIGENTIVGNDLNEIKEIVADSSQKFGKQQGELGTHNVETICNVTEKLPVQETTNDGLSTDNVTRSNNVVIESVIELTPATTGICDTNPPAENNKNIIPGLNIIEIMNITDNETNDIQLIEEQSTTKTSTGAQKTAAPTGLGLLSQYESDADENDSNESETASVIEVSTAVNKNYRSKVIEIDSDSTETVSSDFESETESEYLTKISKPIEKRIQNNGDDNEDEDDDEEGESKQRGRRQPPRVRGEMLLHELPPIQDLQISVPAEECIELGRVHSIVDQLLLVSALPNSIIVDLDTVLFLERGKRVLGEVFDVLGQVADPLYCVRFNTNQHIQEKGINVGDRVYVAPKTEYTQYVILSSLMKMRGSDASWENDIEPPIRYLDYSDDEEERDARQKMRKHHRQSIKEEEEDKEDVDDKDNDPMKRSRTNVVAENNTDVKDRRVYAGVGKRNYNKRQDRFGQHGAYSPRTYQPHHNTNSWHSHYNQQYQPRPTVHGYRTPYAGPFQQQRPLYRNTSPRLTHFNHCVHPQMQMQAPPAHTILSSQQMTPPPVIHSMPPLMTSSPQMHTMPHHSITYVPNPFAFRSSTLSTQFSQTKSATSNQSPAEPAPPGAD